MAYGVGNYSGDNAAEKTYADLYRAMYADWQNRFEPYQDVLMNAATSTEMLDEQLARISATTQRTKQQSEQTAAMNRGRLGIQQSETQKAANENRMGISSSLADINAKNTARTAAGENYESVMTGGALGAYKPGDVSVGGGGTSS
ncbi:TPA: hypothetical protein ACX3EJ_001034 [Vibrio parahaemolyticus]|uniref:hypothetical protein n=1 Tax=Vibrio parahaemolyticus TaxID=670 RepID=UPI000A395C3D|nr:hypothetical protein [Vibrio parahaemolyticus]EGQ8030252.1 hypothetical protein [Vibrio parahaemolyticus]EHV9720244.1 hypothetical protein [Vibrio parahaemolyticus]OUJ46332.1 hypothetical protein BTZ53_10980 [Vibrio parahaemolyticus]HCG6030279.1 hypothetical protein [Vibrio parahaemolyticus]HDF8527416.1 hypothetical protein [Vibrio parahaemolyticus]